MPLIDLRSNLSLKRQVTSIGNSAYAVAESHVDKLLELLTSSKGVEFAAKQAVLDPTTAVRRLAAISKQVSVGFGVPGVGYAGNGSFQSVFPKYTPPISPNYYHNKGVRAKISDQVFLTSTDLEDSLGLDVIPFYFTSYVLSDGNVEMGRSLGFRSFFSSIQDSVTGNWNSFTYTGRGEMLYVYGSRARTMNFSFKTAAFNPQQLDIMHEKVRKLKSFAAPSYNPNGYMQGNFYKLTIGSYVKAVPGIITNVGVTIEDNVPWEIDNMDSYLPHVLNINVAFTVLENQTPQAEFLTDAEMKIQTPATDTTQAAVQPTQTQGLQPVIEVGPLMGEAVDLGSGTFVSTNGQFGLR